MGNIDVRKLSVCPLWVSFLFQLFCDIVLLFSIVLPTQLLFHLIFSSLFFAFSFGG